LCVAACRPARQARVTSRSKPVAPVSGEGSLAITGMEEKRTSLRLYWGRTPPQLLFAVSLTYFAAAPPKSTVVLCA
jgi:hypothetical protein